jgi:cellulose synthase/poly-beta-1,6-N-acetylglucosamine synthase-like glycosyltransferase
MNLFTNFIQYFIIIIDIPINKMNIYIYIVNYKRVFKSLK